MKTKQAAIRFLTIGFLAAISSAGVMQVVSELGQGKRPQALSIFAHFPTVQNLRAYEQNLEEESLVVRTLRPWIQLVQFVLLKDAGEKALIGHDGWLFYRLGVTYFSERPHAGNQPGSQTSPLNAILEFRDQLKERNIRLLVVPTPNKVSIYPDKLTDRGKSTQVALCQQTRELLEELQAADVEVVDLFQLFAEKKTECPGEGIRHLYLAQDTHWSPTGLLLAARAVGQRLLSQGWINSGTDLYESRQIQVERVGDVVRMLQIPQLERRVAAERMTCSQIVLRRNGALYEDDPNSAVLVLGDSFLRVYESDDPGGAGFIAHLAQALQQPLTSIVNDGGASTLVRQELYRRPELLATKKVVVWQFVERDIRYGTEGWQVVPLPPIPNNR